MVTMCCPEPPADGPVRRPGSAFTSAIRRTGVSAERGCTASTIAAGELDERRQIIQGRHS